jgi:ABC-type branched-subunit amino acid transport system ATPase component
MVANRDGVDSSPLGALLRMRTRRREKIAEAHAWETLERFDLTHLANHPGGKISGGQQRLLELARVSQLKPRVLMLDEPTAGVSPLLRPVMVEHIARLRQETGCAVILVEHNMAVVEALADWIHVMARGKLLSSGEMHQIREDPHVREAYLGTSPAAAGQLGGGREGTRR